MVPSAKDSKDLSKIIEANKNSNKGQLDLLSRMNLVFSSKDLEDDRQELDQTIDNLDRFLRLLLSNHQVSGDRPSQKAKRLAKAFWKVRRHALNLYTAVSKSWLTGCHQQHEAKLLLENRLDESLQSRLGQRNNGHPVHVFQVIFSADVAQYNYIWHDSAVQVFDEPDYASSDEPDEPTNDKSSEMLNSYTRESRREATPTTPKVHFSLVTPPSTPRRSKFIEVRDICSAIHTARRDEEHVLFSLTIDCQITKSPSALAAPRSMEVKQTVTLKDLFTNQKDDARGMSLLSWKSRMLLALNVATSFLQLLHTPWSAPEVSTETIGFLQPSSSNADAARPFLSQQFHQSSPAQHHPTTRSLLHEAILELGITLLEIWHTTTLEQKFSLVYKPSRYEKQSRAMEWYDEAQGVLPDNYLKAVFHCIAGVKNVDSGRLDWDNIKLWETFCECVIEPLSKLSKI